MTAAVVVQLWRTNAAISGTEALALAGIEAGDTTNVAHTTGLTLLAHAPVRVGVDVEFVRARTRLDALARRTMNDAEHEAWNASDDRTRAFLQHWTRVEAYLKALRVGVRGGLRTRPGDGWALVDLDLGATHVGALAIETKGRPVRLEWRALDAGEWSYPEVVSDDPTPDEATEDDARWEDDYLDEQLAQHEPATEATDTPPPMSRFRQGSIGLTLGAALTGLANVLEPRKKEEAPVVVQHDEPDQSDDPIELRLDRNDPSASVVIIRPHLRDDH